MAGESTNTNTIVEYLYQPGGPLPYKCGYCKRPDTSYTQGVWGHKMTCQDFQDLVDRGFQRSGKFVYKPEMKITCCPQYVIRMDAKRFKLSKSQKSSIRKFKRYLKEGNAVPEGAVSESAVSESAVSEGAVPEGAVSEGAVPEGAVPESSVPEGAVSESSVSESGSCPIKECTPISESADQPKANECTSQESMPLQSPPELPPKVKKAVKPGVGPDPNKPPCKKAKVLRRERREARQLRQMDDTCPQTSDPASTSCDKSGDQYEVAQNLQDILTFPKDAECVHQFKTQLVKIDSKEFTDTYQDSFEVFKKFQMIIHKESEADTGEKQFKEFLVYTPLEPSERMSVNLGTYHQQYFLDGKIFAVGVLDIIPKGVLCEYLYYDPEYRFIAPGVITALLEITLTQKFYLQNPEMQYYYMGFYVQSCPKMNYKRRYSASHLLCPETYTYIPLEKCIPKLKASAYSRLAEDLESTHTELSEEEMKHVPVLADGTPMTYTTYLTLYGKQADEMVREYVQLVGVEKALSMRMYLNNMRMYGF